MSWDGASIQLGEERKLGQVASTSIATEWDSNFEYIMEDLVDYDGMFATQYGVKFSDAMIKDILEDTISSSYLLMRRRATFRRYVWFARLLLKNRKLLLLLEWLSVEHIMGKDHNISHLEG